MRRLMLLTVLVTTGCAAGGGGPAGSPSPVAPASPVASSRAVDAAGPTCREAKKIVDDGSKVTIERLYEVGDRGARSADNDIRFKAQLLSNFAVAAATRIQAGGDPAKEAGMVSEALADLVDTCKAAHYI